MTKEFIPYEQALKLKELGFNELTFCTWLDGKLISIHSKEDLFQNSTLAPLWQQAFDWLVSKITNELYVEDFMIAHLNEYSSKKEAQFACLNKLIEIVEQQNK